jgi:hypothetical protein
MKKFFSMLLFLLFAVAVNVAVQNGPSKHQHESQYVLNQAQPVNVVSVSIAQIYQPEKGFFSYGVAYRQGDVEKSSYENFNLIGCNLQSKWSPNSDIMRSGYFKLNTNLLGNRANSLDGRYRLDIGENYSQVGVTTRHT